MERKRLIIGGVVVGALAVGAGIFFLTTSRQTRDDLLGQIEGGGSAGLGHLEASGFIEAEQVDLAASSGGRVMELPFEEGDEVAAGDVVVQLDPALLEAQLQAADAQVDIAEAQLALVEAGPRQEVVDQARGQVALSEAALNAAKVAYQDALAQYADPQTIELQLVEARAQVAVAQQQLGAAQVGLHAAERAQELYYSALDFWEDKNGHICKVVQPGVKYCQDFSIPLDSTLSPQKYQAAQAEFTGAQEALTNAEVILGELEDFANNPAGLLAQASQAEAAFSGAEAALARAQAELDVLESDVREEDIAIAEARVAQAEAARDVIATLIEQMEIDAPIDGIILQQALHVGELAAPGLPVVTLANLDVVELTVYIATTDLDKVSLGQNVSVSVDSFPRETFDGKVTFIADEAEFTPRNVQTQEERVNLVFAVKIQIDNPDHSLKPGMPADAAFE